MNEDLHPISLSVLSYPKSSHGEHGMIMTRWWVKERTMIVVVLRVGLLRGHCEIYLYNLWVAGATFNRPETLPPQ